MNARVPGKASMRDSRVPNQIVPCALLAFMLRPSR